MGSIYEDLYKNDCLKIENIKLSNGKISDYYFDTKKIYNNSELLNKICDLIIVKINKYVEKNNIEYEHIGFVPYGSLPLATIISQKLNKSLLFCRKEQKGYGNNTIIEGKYQIGDNVLLIEDVITTGKSILNTIKKYENVGVIIASTFCILDRETDAIFDIKNDLNYDVNPLIKISSFINDLLSKRIIDDFQHSKVSNSIILDKKFYNNDKENKKNILKKKQEKKENILSGKVFLKDDYKQMMMELIIKKQTNLCLSLDVNTWNEAKIILDLCGPFICMVKIHSDLFIDLNSTSNINNFIFEIKNLAKKHHFFIMEDRKINDVDKIAYNQIYDSMFKYTDWCNFITCQNVNGESLLKYVTYVENDMNNKNKDNKDFVNFINLFEPCIIVQMNQKNNLINDLTINKTIEYLENDDNIMRSPLIICQSLPNINNKIKVTPGVKFDESRNNKTRNYRSIEDAIVKDKNHIIIIGSEIIEKYKQCYENHHSKKFEEKDKDHNDFIEFMGKIKNTGWNYFYNTNKNLIEKINKVIDLKYNNNEDDIYSIIDNFFELKNVKSKNDEISDELKELINGDDNEYDNSDVFYEKTKIEKNPYFINNYFITLTIINILILMCTYYQLYK